MTKKLNLDQHYYLLNKLGQDITKLGTTISKAAAEHNKRDTLQLLVYVENVKDLFSTVEDNIEIILEQHSND